jgi:hypothetical protein
LVIAAGGRRPGLWGLALNLFTRSFKPESLAGQDAFLSGGGHCMLRPFGSTAQA